MRNFCLGFLYLLPVMAMTQTMSMMDNNVTRMLIKIAAVNPTINRPLYPENKQHSIESPDLSRIQAILGPQNPIESVLKTPISNIYQIDIGSEIYYLSADGRYLFQGNLIDLKNKSNLTENHRAFARIAEIRDIPKEDLIVYPAIGEKLFTVTVFSDVDCAYCQMLNQQIDEYRSLGIEIHIAAFPRTGLDSLSYQKANAVWCAENRQEAFNRATMGLAVISEVENCHSPVKEEYLAGVKIGINTTPAFVLENGALIPGYIGPENLYRLLQSELSINDQAAR